MIIWSDTLTRKQISEAATKAGAALATRERNMTWLIPECEAFEFPTTYGKRRKFAQKKGARLSLTESGERSNMMKATEQKSIATANGG